MTLMLKLDLHMVKIFLCSKYEVPGFSDLTVKAWTNTHTHKPGWKYYLSAYPDSIYTKISEAFLPFWNIHAHDLTADKSDT